MDCHDYAIDVQATYPDVIFGHWLQIDPRTGREGVAEFERCAAACRGFIGICVSAPGMGYAASDPIFDPFYQASIALQRPVLVLVGTTGSGAGQRGGGGVLLDLSHPRYIDALSVRHPDLTIIAGRNPWPWTDDMSVIESDVFVTNVLERALGRIVIGEILPDVAADRVAHVFAEDA